MPDTRAPGLGAIPSADGSASLSQHSSYDNRPFPEGDFPFATGPFNSPIIRGAMPIANSRGPKPGRDRSTPSAPSPDLNP
jgi:hypothetical protein